MKERIQKIIAASGVCSRRKAELLLSEGRITINGSLAALGESADPDTDLIFLDGSPIQIAEKQVYILLNKPRGYVTTMSDDRGRKTVADLVQNAGARIFPVGRLDYDTDGLLLMTNNGMLANCLMHPSFEHNKTYIVQVASCDAHNVELLKRQIVLDGKRISPPEVAILSDDPKEHRLSVTIHEGRNRQVRRMCAEAGLQVLRLTRVSEGCLRLGDLKIGSWRYLTPEELVLLSAETGLKL